MQLELLPREKFWLDRIRAKKTQYDYPKRFGVGKTVYYKVELGIEPIPPSWVIPEPKNILAREWCAVLRHRFKLTLPELAELSGMALHTLTLYEAGRPRNGEPALRYLLTKLVEAEVAKNV